MTECVCCSGLRFDECCERFLSGSLVPTTPEELMRSRYAAYVAEDAEYLLATWSPKTRPKTLTFESCRWLGLKVKNRSTIDGSATEGCVHFVARYKVSGKAFRIEENSYFVRDNNRWFYVSERGDKN